MTRCQPINANHPSHRIQIAPILIYHRDRARIHSHRIQIAPNLIYHPSHRIQIAPNLIYQLLRSYAKMKFQFEVVIAVAALQTAVAEDHHNLRARRLQCNRCLDSINRVSACESRIGDVKCGACIGEEGSFIDPRSPAPICIHVPFTYTRTFLSLLFSNIYTYMNTLQRVLTPSLL